MPVTFTVVKRLDSQVVNRFSIDLISSDEINIFEEFTKITFTNLVNVIRYRVFENIKMQSQLTIQMPIENIIDINLDDYKNKNDKYMDAALNIFTYRKLYTDLLAIQNIDNYMILIN